MPDIKSPEAAKRELERRLNPRIKCEERVTFDIPNKEGCGGVVKTLSQSGCLLLTIERFASATEVAITFTLSLHDERMECTVTGTVTNLDLTVEKPLRGYGIVFNENNPDVVKRAIRDVVESRDRLAPPVAPTPKAKVEEPAAESNRPAPPLNLPPLNLPPLPRPPVSTKAEKTDPAISPPLPSSSDKGKGWYAGLGAILIISAGWFAYGYFYSGPLKSELASIIPIESFKTEETDVFVGVSPEWISKTSETQKREQLVALSKAIVKRKFYSVYLMDRDQKTVGRVMMAMGNESLPPLITLGPGR